MSGASAATDAPAPRVAVIGGGLAGMATAVGLRSAGCRVELFEARRYLGGRATSFRDPQSGEQIDLCQHVSMGCCTNLADFCRRTQIAPLFRRVRVLHFIGPDGRQCDLTAAPLLPAPLHLGPALWGLTFLTRRDRLRIAHGLWQLARLPAAGRMPDTTVPDTTVPEPTVLEWLTRAGQSAAAIERFWSVVLVSALGESLDRAGVAAGRKVFVEGFMTSRSAYEVEVPQASLSEIYDVALRRWFEAAGVALRMETPLREITLDDGQLAVILADSTIVKPDAVVLAVPWRQVAGLVGPSLRTQLDWLATASNLESSPISGVHLWYDRPITALEHAVLVGRTSQWLFQRGPSQAEGASAEHYYQVVISAARDSSAAGQEATLHTVCGELAEIFPAARQARLIRGRVVTDPQAVFSVRPGSELLRPTQRTAVPRLAVAGDWTKTGWPATMEGAVRSGYLAAEQILEQLGRPQPLLCPELPRSWLARALFGNT